MNETLKTTHDLLIADVEALSKAIHGTQDMKVAEQLLLEMHEVVHRVDLIQNLLFTQGSAELDAYLPSIRGADNSLRASIRSLKDAADVITKTTELLKYVDQAVDLAKTLAVI
jgi:hypothetical protein